MVTLECLKIRKKEKTMNLIQRFKHGLDVGLRSFGLLQEHKKLLFYLGTPIILGIIIELVALNLSPHFISSTGLFTQGIMVKFWETFGWTKHLGLFLTEMIKLFVIIFFSVSLTDHVIRIMKHETSSIKNSIHVAFSKLRLIALWALASTLFFVLVNQIDTIMNTTKETPSYILALIVSLISRITWSLATIFIIPIITLKTLSTVKTIRTSIDTTKKCLIEYLGAIAWIVLIWLLGFAPFLLFQFQGKLFQTVMYAALALLGCIISTTHSILKTDLYLKYK